MIEKEKRENVIAKLAVMGCVRNPKANTNKECEVCDFKEGMCNAYRHATKLYDYILRREEEARNEVVREILDWLNTNTYTVAIYKKGLNAFLKEKFGVEVE